MDARGYLWYIDRIKDTIRRRGENISSFEVEAVLLEHPTIAEVAAVAVQASEGGEDEVLVCIILKADAETPRPEDLLDFCVPRMPYFAVPRYVEFVDEIPTTPTAKIQKNKLRERGLTATAWDREARRLPCTAVKPAVASITQCQEHRHANPRRYPGSRSHADIPGTLCSVPAGDGGCRCRQNRAAGRGTHAPRRRQGNAARLRHAQFQQAKPDFESEA
jgi:hypothetical protein